MFTESVNVKGNLEVILLDETGKQKDYRQVTTPAATSQTALGTELGRVALDSTTRATNTITYVATFPAGTGTGAITEAGILNAGATGNMLCRTVFGVVTKASGDTVVITWNVTVA